MKYLILIIINTLNFSVNHFWGRVIALHLILLGSSAMAAGVSTSSFLPVGNHKQLESRLKDLTADDITRCISDHQIDHETLCFIFSKEFPIHAYDKGIEKTLADFAKRSTGTFSWNQEVQLEDGYLYDKLVEDDMDDVNMEIAVKSYPESILMLTKFYSMRKGNTK